LSAKMKMIYVNGGIAGALEYLVHEWAYKVARIVNYGGVWAGTRGPTVSKATWPR